MKKILFTLALMLTLSTGMQAAAQKHRHTPQPVMADSTDKNGIDVFSDTTTTDSSTVNMTGTVYGTNGYSRTYEFHADSWEGFVQGILSNMDDKSIAGMFFVLCVLFIIFVLAPVFIIIALFYFINKNRKQKMRLAEMAMRNGQPIPDQLLDDNKNATYDDEYQKGMRQCFVGVGLMIFLGYAAGSVGFGIGALVFCIGLGKVFASKTAGRNNNNQEI